MKKKRFTESQIVGILKEGEAGIPVPELCQNMVLEKAPTIVGNPSMVA